MTDQPLLRRFVTLAIVFFVVLPLCLFVYSRRGNDYKLSNTTNSQLVLTNSGVLQDWMNQDVYDFTLRRLGDFFDEHNITVSSMTVSGNQVYLNSDGTLDFQVRTLPNNRTYSVDVITVNSNGVLSNNIYVNGNLQTYTPVKNSGVTSFGNFDSLIDNGLSTVQVTELQKSMQKFKSNANSIKINSSTLYPQQADDGSGNFALNFSVAFDNTNYSATVLYGGLTDVHLYLRDSTGATVYDSGLVDTSD